MSSSSSRSRGSLVGAFALGAALCQASWAGERFTVCSITINSNDEIETFRRNLPESEFQLVELTGPSSSWFADSCQSGPQCDVVVLSGHFGDTYAGNFGTTFAGDRGLSLSLDELEQRRCESSCPGVLGKPLEVFLFGCKTLATSLEDRPLPPQDLALLSKHRIPQGTAERVVEEERYRGSDTSNRRRMGFVFTGVPNLYGFSYVAPSGEHARPLLEEYFKNEGDYGAHLRRLQRARAKNPDKPIENRTLAQAFRPSFFAESPGLAATDPEYERDMRICGLRNDHDSIVARLEQIEKLLDDPGFIGYLPAIESFLREHPPTAFAPAEVAALDRVRAHAHAREVLTSLVGGLTTPLLRLEMVRVANSLGWISDDQALGVKRDVVMRALQPPVYGEGRDVVCRIEPEALRKIVVRAEDLRPEIYGDEFGLQALACLKPSDERIQLALSRALFDRRDWIAREAAIALAAIKPALVDVQLALAQQLGRTDAGPRQWAGEALREAKANDPRVLEMIRKTDPSFKIDWL